MNGTQHRTCTLLLAAAVAGGLWLAGCGGQDDPAARTASGTGSDRPAVSRTSTTTPPVSKTPATTTGPATGGDPATAGGAQMSFAGDTHDFGSVSDVRPVTHSFEFTNTGTAALEISDVKTSCGCTQAQASRTHVPPGERGTIDVTYTPRGDGQHTYRVTVTSNAPEAHVQIRADIDPFVAIEPRKLDLGVLPLHQGHTSHVTLSCRDAGMTLKEMSVRHEHLKVRAVEGAAEGLGAAPSAERPGRIVLEVTVDKAAPWGELSATMLVTVVGRPADSQETVEHQLFIPFAANIFDDIHVEPEMFRLGVIKPGAPVESKVRVTHAAGGTFRVVQSSIENANVEGLAVRVTPAEGEGGTKGFDLTLAGDLKGHTGPVNGTVVFTTDVAGETPRILRFSGIVR